VDRKFSNWFANKCDANASRHKGQSVRFAIDEKEVDSYRRAADFLNVNNAEVIPSGDTAKATTKVSICCRRLLRLPTLKSRAILPSRQACFASFKLPLTARNRPLLSDI
jgi:hypothetical protein